MAIGDSKDRLVWEGFLSPVVDSDETMVELIVGFDGNEAPPPPTLRTSGSKSDDNDLIERKIHVDVTLPPSNCLLPFAQVDPENKDDEELNRLLSEYCAHINSMALEPVA